MYLAKIKSIHFSYQNSRLCFSVYVTGEKMLITSCPGWGSNPRPSAQKSNTLPRRYKSRLVPQGSTNIHIPNTTTYFPSIFRFVLESQFELPRTYTRHGCAPRPSDGLFTLGAKCNRSKNANHLLPRLRIEPATLRTKIQHSTTSL